MATNITRRVLCIAVAIFAGCTQHASSTSAQGQVTAFVGARVYTSAADSVIDDATILVADGRITAVGTRSAVSIPTGATVVSVTGMTAVPGLWNSHVHFFKPEWLAADTANADRLSKQFQQMLLRYGYVRVIDSGSFIRNTLALRNRIQSGQVIGPAILTAGEPLYPRGGVPAVAKSFGLPEAGDASEADAWAKQHLADGADLLKVFSGAGYSGQITVMAPDVIKAVVNQAHASRKLVYAHPQTVPGWQSSMDGDVDVLAHTPDPSGLDNAKMLRALRDKGTAVIPTLKLWGVDVSPGMTDARRAQVVSNGVQQIRAFNDIGGIILFGTDVGYMDDADPREEYVLLARAGLTFRQVLAAMTTTPARLFGLANETGRIAPGLSADLVFLAQDPAADVSRFADVRLAVLKGRTVFDASTMTPGTPRL